LIPAAGALMFTLVTATGLGIVPAGVIAIVACTALAAAMATAIMRPMSNWRRGSGRGGLSESAVLDSAIVSFALYLPLVNVLQ
jgi:hypothetical protein